MLLAAFMYLEFRDITIFIIFVVCLCYCWFVGLIGGGCYLPIIFFAIRLAFPAHRLSNDGFFIVP